MRRKECRRRRKVELNNQGGDLGEGRLSREAIMLFLLSVKSMRRDVGGGEKKESGGDLELVVIFEK